jgi:hypothetical protein
VATALAALAAAVEQQPADGAAASALSTKQM